MVRRRLLFLALTTVGLAAGCSSMADRPFFARFRSYPVEGDCCSAGGGCCEGPALGDAGPGLPPPGGVPMPLPPDQPLPTPTPLPPGAAPPRLNPVPQAQPLEAQPTSRAIIR
jgi:hypothetical protein